MCALKSGGHRYRRKGRCLTCRTTLVQRYDMTFPSQHHCGYDANVNALLPDIDNASLKEPLARLGQIPREPEELLKLDRSLVR